MQDGAEHRTTQPRAQAKQKTKKTKQADIYNRYAIADLNGVPHIN